MQIERILHSLFLESRGKKKVTDGKCEESLKRQVIEPVLNCCARE